VAEEGELTCQVHFQLDVELIALLALLQVPQHLPLCAQPLAPERFQRVREQDPRAGDIKALGAERAQRRILLRRTSRADSFSNPNLNMLSAALSTGIGLAELGVPCYKGPELQFEIQAVV
jgi:hypothetical protein